MPSSRAWPTEVVSPSRSTGPMRVTFTSGNGAPAGSLTVTVRTAVAVAGAARGRLGGVAGAWVVGAGAGGGVCASANAGVHRTVRSAAVARMFITLLSPETVGKGWYRSGRAPRKGCAFADFPSGVLRGNRPNRRYMA